ncbi:MAG TPA: alanine--tRNA ligase-related protein [Candidatus Paceibacterota bacterium]
MDSSKIRQRFLDFFIKHRHVAVPSSSLIPTDPSVLLTTAGMQQFKPYYTDVANPMQDFGSKNAVSIQKSFRTSDIDEVGDDSHLTFFEMLGNFSFGGYFKEEAIKLAHEFITQELGLEISFVTIFGGLETPLTIPKDEESKKIWQALGIKDIREEGMADVFWGPTGTAGPCGPTTEIYCRNARDQEVEIWNIVFNQFFFSGMREELLSGTNKKLESLSTPGVDTGMGLERLAMIAQKKTNLFETDLFAPIINLLPTRLSKSARRIVADHLRAISFLISDGVTPSNKGVGYVLRRLLRRVIVYACDATPLVNEIVNSYQVFYPGLNKQKILEIYNEEKTKCSEALNNGLRELKKMPAVDTITAFKLYESYGLPFEVIKDCYPDLSREEFEKEFTKHQEISRVGSERKFSGGLVDHELLTIRLHTAHHLLLAALQQMFGKQVKQRGSNINQERLRLDFSFNRQLTNEEKEKIENLVNQKITENLLVTRQEMKKVEAEKLGAEMEFGQKYGETVSVYFIGGGADDAFSIEFCGGPHVVSTSELGKFKITKEEAVSQGVRRIKAVLKTVH